MADDYYQSGLAINRELGLLERASQLGMSARVAIRGRDIIVELRGSPAPPALRLFLSHPLDADQDAVFTLASIGPGLFQARLEQPLQYRWLWKLQPLGVDAQSSWRLDGELTATQEHEQ